MLADNLEFPGAHSLSAQIERSAPLTLFVLLVALKAVAWTLAPTLTHLAVPLDVAESYGWGREWIIGSDKHPNLPGLILELTRQATGAIGWPAYLVSQLFVAATYAAVFVLGRDLMGTERALAGTLLLGGIAFYAWPTVEFNHNVAQMPFWALLPLTVWRAVERRDAKWWIAFGILAALSLYAKLSMLLLIAVLCVFILRDASARRQLRTPWPWAALLIFCIGSAPLASWLLNNGFAPIAYASSRASGAQSSFSLYFTNISLNLLGFFLLLALVGLIDRRSMKALRTERSTLVSPRTVQFLLLIGLAPMVIALAISAFNGTGIKATWSSSMFTHAGLLAIALLAAHYRPEHLQRLFIAAFTIAVVAPTCYAAVVVAGPIRNGAPMRVNWPQAEISRRFVEIWEAEMHTPLRIVGGSNWISDLIALPAKSRPSVFASRSPWVTEERIRKEGVLFVWNGRRDHPSRIAEPYVRNLQIREERFPLRSLLHEDEVIIRYAILPPAQ